MRKERKGQMPFTSEAVVAHWSSPRNIIFLSPCGGLHPWQHQEHPRSCGVSSKIAWRGVFIKTEIWPTETTSPSAHIMSQSSSLGCWLGLAAPADYLVLWEWGQVITTASTVLLLWISVWKTKTKKGFMKWAWFYQSCTEHEDFSLATRQPS